MVETLDGMRGTLSNVPALVDLQNRQIRFDYVRSLSDSDQQLVYADLIDNRMFGQPGRAFLRHYYRRDENRMGTPAFNESPDDTAIPSNPMFRYDGPILVPYMHNEVDGYILGKFLDNLLVALVTALVSYTALLPLRDALQVNARTRQPRSVAGSFTSAGGGNNRAAIATKSCTGRM